MRRLALLLFVLFLVNLPIVSQKLSERALEREGREVVATVLDSSRRGESYYVDYRLPVSVDPEKRRWSAQVDSATFERARETRELGVRVVPSDPATQRADGTPANATFLVVAVLGDTVLLAIAVIAWRRHRRWNLFEVVDVEPGAATLRGTAGTFTAAAPEAWTARLTGGQRVSGRFHLVAEHDVVPGGRQPGLEQDHGVVHVASGRVLDTRAGWVELDLGDGWRLRVETGPHRVRVDIRDSTQVRGVLCFTPR